MYDDFCNVTVTAADEIVISGAGHAASIMGIVCYKYAATAKLQRGIHSMINQGAAGFCHQLMDGHRIAKIVAMHDMYGKAKFEGGTQSLCTYHIPAMNNSLRARCMCGRHGSSEGFGTIMTVGDDADFQFFAVF